MSQVRIMVIKAVIFDMDGTITAFNLDYMTLRSEVRGFLIRAGVPASVIFVNESIFDMLNKTEIFFRNNGKSARTLENVRNEALAIAEKHELEAAKTTGLLPGVIETLKKLKEMGVQMGLCTVNSERSTNYILKRFGIADFFDAVIPRNKVKRVKPSGEHLEAVLKALEVKPKEALVVGDGTRDMESAKEMKVLAIGLPTGVSSQEELIRSGADSIITSFADIPNLIETARAVAKESRKKRAKP